jgi:hypothetical protein
LLYNIMEEIVEVTEATEEIVADEVVKETVE